MVSPRRTSLLTLVVLPLLAVSVLPAIAAPPPEQLCGCDDAVEAGAATHGLEMTAPNSTATVTVHENGSATWLVQVEIADVDAATVERLRTNATLRDSVVDGAVRGTQFWSSSVDGDTLVARFHDPSFADRSAGVLRSEAFTNHHEGYLRLASLGADELTVVAPSGAVVGWTVPGATVSDDGSRMTVTDFDERDVGHFVTFVPRGDALGPLRSLVAVAEYLAPTVLLNAGLFVVLSSGVFALSFGGVSVVLSRGVDSLSVGDSASTVFSNLPKTLSRIGLVVTAVALVGILGAGLFGASAGVALGLCLGVGTLGVACSWLGQGYRAIATAAVAAVLVSTAVATGWAVVVEGTSLRLVSVPTTIAVSLSVFTLAPAGSAFAQRRAVLAVGTATLGFLALTTAAVPLAAPHVGLTGPFTWILAVVVPLLGSPLLLAGLLLANDP